MSTCGHTIRHLRLRNRENSNRQLPVLPTWSGILQLRHFHWVAVTLLFVVPANSSTSFFFATGRRGRSTPLLWSVSPLLALFGKKHKQTKRTSVRSGMCCTHKPFSLKRTTGMGAPDKLFPRLLLHQQQGRPGLLYDVVSTRKCWVLVRHSLQFPVCSQHPVGAVHYCQLLLSVCSPDNVGEHELNVSGANGQWQVGYTTLRLHFLQERGNWCPWLDKVLSPFFRFVVSLVSNSCYLERCEPISKYLKKYHVQNSLQTFLLK